MLIGQRRDGIDARAGLHCPCPCFIVALFLVGAIDLSLDGAFLFGSALGLLLEARR